MVYHWDGKQDEVYQLYVVERKSLDELVKHMKEKYQFEPSKRAYQTQFKRWNFPSKLSPAHQNADLVNRVRQLWEKNCGQKDMLGILLDEGWDVNESDLMRLRSKNGWLLRGSTGYQATQTRLRAGAREKSSQAANADAALDDIAAQLSHAAAAAGGGEEHGEENATSGDMATVADYTVSPQMPGESPVPLTVPFATPHTDPELKRQHEARVSALKAESDERWATKKRRRRTQGWAGLPADPPGPPRYPSETTLDESKAFLHLDNAQYQNLREQIQEVCESEGIDRKTAAGPEKWQHIKDRLTAQNTNLHREFYGPYNGIPQQSKTIALDVICLDVTKAVRTKGQRMTLADAKNVLGLNPLQSRDVRSEFYEVLREGRFLSKAETGDERWQQLKTNWIAQSEVIQGVLNGDNGEGGPPDQELTAKRNKAVDALCRDVMKRVRDDITRVDPSLKRKGKTGPGPGPATAKPAPPSPKTSANTPSSSRRKSQAAVGSRSTPATKRQKTQHQHDPLIDPSLIPAPFNDPSPAQLQAYAASAESTQHHQHHHQHAQQQPPTPHQPFTAPNPTLPSRSSPIAALFRLHPSSTLPTPLKTWIGTLSSTSVIELIQTAGAQHGAAVVVKRVEGMIAATGGTGADVPLPIERDDELAAYFAYVGTAGMGKAVFGVVLASAMGS